MRIKEVEDRLKVKQEDLLKYVEDLKEISVREEQVIATMATVKEREETIESLKRDLKHREEEIERLRCEIQANPNSSLTIRATSCTETRRNTERSKS